jgi:hypothetical protein
VSFRALQIEAYIQNVGGEKKQAQPLSEHASEDDDDDNSYR